jgi:phage baseplate assembly protein W
MMIGMSRVTGLAIDGDAHLQQSIRDILTTPIGSRVMRRDYGSLIPFLIDQPANALLLMRLRAVITHALLTWEPRVRPTKIHLHVTAQGVSQLTLAVERTHMGQGSTFTLGLRSA